MPRQQDFPDTDQTWIRDRLQAGDQAKQDLLQHLMLVYAEPLQRLARRYFRCTDELACDLVHGFFASRLSREQYLTDWEGSGIPLHRWLWTGLRFYAREHNRDRVRLPTVDPAALDELDRGAPGIDAEVDRAFTNQLIRAAFTLAESMCAAEGFADHWAVFVRRNRDGHKFLDIARELGLTLGRVVVMQRAPTLRFRNALRLILERDGVRREDVPRVIDSLLESIGVEP